jgi:predicted nucleotidyltransferase
MLTLFDKFLEVIARLEKENVDYILIGGFAVILYGMPRLTQDVDLFLRNDSENINRLQKALYDVFQDDSVWEITADELDRYPVIRYGTPDGFSLDFIVKIGTAFTYDDLKYELIEVEGRSIRVATAETLYRLKKDTLRPIDQNDAAFLSELLRRGKEKEKE